MSQWDDLSMREKAAMMRVAVKNKMFDIDQIKEAYNSQNKQVSNSEVINPNQYTPSVNLNVNPALDYVGNALESISGYEYEGNPLNKLGIDMSLDLGTTGSRMYPNGIRFVKKFGEGGNYTAGNINNKFYDGGYVDPTMYGMPDQFTPPITYEDYVDPKTPGQLVGKTALQLLDFTGVSSYPDVINSYEEFKKDPGFVNGLILGLNALSAIPLIGKVGKTSDLVNNVASAIKPAVKQTVKATRAAKGQSTSGKAFNKAVKKAVKKETEKALQDNSLIHQGVLNVNSTIDTLPELFWFTRKGAEKTQDLTTKYLTQPIFNNWLPQTAKSYRTTNAAIDYLNFSRNLGAFADYYNYYYKDNKDIKNNKETK